MDGVGSRTIDVGAAGILAGATGYSVLALSGSPAATAVSAAAAFLAAKAGLGRIEDRPRLPLPRFALPELNAEAPDEPPELLLTELAELLLTEPVLDELLLDDRLDQPSPDSRVIRLFDPRTLPSAGELNERIERHLRDPAERTYPDATGELHEALAALRKSLR